MVAGGVVWIIGGGVAMGDTASFTSAGTCSQWVVPIGVSSVAIDAIGAGGTAGTGSVPGGLGDEIQRGLAVTHGETLDVCVDVGGGQGASGGGNGGGASGVSTAADFSAPVLVAAGGGGGGAHGTLGGGAGGNGDTPGGGVTGIGPGGAVGGGSPSTSSGPGGGGPANGAGGGGGGGGFVGGGGGTGGNLLGSGGGAGGSNYCNDSSCTAPTTTSNSPAVTLTYAVASPPTASITTPSNGATYVLGKAVHSSFTCADDPNGPGISSCTDQNGQGSGGRIDTSTAGKKTFTVTATSSDGEISTSTVTYSVAAPPLIRVVMPVTGAVYLRGQQVRSLFACGEGAGGFGIASCVDQNRRASGARVDTSSLGVHIFTVTGASTNGQVVTAIARYTVVRRPTLSKLRTRHGIVTFTVTVPAGGAVDAVATTSFKRSGLSWGSDVVATRSGKVPMLLIPSRPAKLLLRSHRHLTLHLIVQYTAKNGLPQIVARPTLKIAR